MSLPPGGLFSDTGAIVPNTTPLRSGFRFGPVDVPIEFAHPPLIEVWLGAEFDSSVDLTSISPSEWRKKLGPEWPATAQSIGAAERHNPASTQIEQQLQNVMGDRAIRFGKNGFCYGWLGYDGNHYPRYETIRDGFVATLDAIQSVVPQIGDPHHSVVTYLNRIPQGTVWMTAQDWSFFRLWQPNPFPKLQLSTDHFAGHWQFPLDGDRGTLGIELSHEAPATPADVESLWLRISCSGPTDSEETSLFDGLDYGREIIVRTFNDLMNSDAKKFWGVGPRK